MIDAVVHWLRGHERGALWLAWAACASFVAAQALASGGAPGLYYDEAWLAQQARAFVEPTREGLMPPGAISTWLAGRPFPLFALPYLGSLKSQLEIVPIALFGHEVEVVRATTLALALAGLFATMRFARRAAGAPAAALCGALIALDPGFVFHAQWEWGPFTTGLLCRSAGAWGLLRGVQQRAGGSLAAGAFALGLGVYNRADFVLILGAAAAGLLVFHRPELLRCWREQRRALLLAAACFALGAAPMLAIAPRVLAAVGELTTRGDLAERAAVLLEVLDGSYAYRLMAVGGRFDAMHAVGAPFALFGVALLVAFGAGVFELLRRGPAVLRADGRGWLLVAVPVLALAMLALPGATRAHHMLNLLPMTHLLVALAALGALRVPPGRASAPIGMRAAVAALLAVVSISDFASIEATRSLIARSGGRGWWSEAIEALARELEQAEPRAAAVSLDWGFHLPLLFLTDRPKLVEPFWDMPRIIATRGRWEWLGDARTRYVVHDAPYDRYGYGPPLLESARSLGARAEVRAWRDREGDVAFYTVRVLAAHRLSLAPGGYRIDVFGAGSAAEPSSTTSSPSRTARASMRSASGSPGPMRTRQRAPVRTASARPAARTAAGSAAAAIGAPPPPALPPDPLHPLPVHAPSPPAKQPGDPAAPIARMSPRQLANRPPQLRRIRTFLSLVALRRARLPKPSASPPLGDAVTAASHRHRPAPPGRA